MVRSRKDTGEYLDRKVPIELQEGLRESAQVSSVFVYPACQVSNPWLGFGGSFTESSAVTLKRMSRAKREEVMRAYFGPPSGNQGLCYTMGRVPIGSCDFSLKSWSCGDTKDDPELKGFTIARYREAILPMLLRASELSGKPLQMLASPWSPPTWMKTSGTFNREGRVKSDCYAAWARHFVLFVQEMEAAGVPIWAVSVQNEPEASQRWESCQWSAEMERDFVAQHLGPALEDAGLDVKIIIWDHNRDGMLERAAIAYSDPKASRYIWGVGYHWYGDGRFETWPECCAVNFEERATGSHAVELRAQAGFNNVRRVAELRPDKHILFTESCQELDGVPLAKAQGDWKLGERYAMNIIADINSGTEGWIDWNLCLDEQGGPNHARNFCVAPIICDTRNDRVLYQPAYFYLGQFSRYIRPGARRVTCGTSRDVLEVTAWLNVDGTVVVVVLNQSDDDAGYWLKVHGVGATTVDAPARSITTLILGEELDEDRGH